MNGQAKQNPFNSSSCKLGLALSGGGFRASLFHIGVLARLAELDLLKSVSVFSTVSGGSIIGAYYYLKVKQLLEGKRKDYPTPCRQAYIQIVKETETDFLAAVQKNIRMRTFLDPCKNVRMLRQDYSRTDHIAELYTKHFYRPLWKNIKRPGESDNIHLSEIKISPLDSLLPAGMRGQPFDVFKYDEKAEFKIPILTINATNLNTGHLWHFTSSWLGEPDFRRLRLRNIDVHRILELLRFDGKDVKGKPLTEKQKKKLQEFTLGDAVAASACVPGIFHPLAIHDLYESLTTKKEIVVQLVDGGVFDNQGLATLFAEECTHIICSDASGQTEDVLNPSTQFFSVIKRSEDILMDRVREDGLNNLFLRERGDQLLTDPAVEAAASPALLDDLPKQLNVRECAFFYLKDSFTGSPQFPDIPGPGDKPDTMIYHLSNIRTDLDSFTDLEAYTLMYDGYCLSGDKIADKTELGYTVSTVGQQREQWRFLTIREVLRTTQQRLLKHLKVAKHNAFKVFLLGVPWAYVAAIPLVALILWLLWIFQDVLILNQMTLGQVSVALGVAILSLNKTVKKALKAARFLRMLKNGVGVLLPWLLLPAVLCFIGSLAVWLHLKIFDWLFLRAGKLGKR